MMFDAEENEDLFCPTSLEEVFEALKYFTRDKCPGPNRWTFEFFLHFFDIMGQHILDIVEESTTLGMILGAINSTFLAFIPKSSKPNFFGDFRPIHYLTSFITQSLS